jgi:hypothetical protein
LFSGTLACTSIIGTRDLEYVDSDAGGATPSHRPSVTDGAEAGTTTSDTGNAKPGTVEPASTVDAGAPDAASPPNINFAHEMGVSATATSSYNGFPVSRLVDGDIKTSWYAGTGACALLGADYSCTGLSATIALAGPRTVGRLVLHGNHDQFTDYDVMSGRWELLAPNNTIISTVSVVPSPPNYDGTTVLQVPVAGVTAVRLVVLAGDATEPGLSEIEIYQR